MSLQELTAALCIMLWPPSVHTVDGRHIPIPHRYVALAEHVAPLVKKAVALEGGNELVLAAVIVRESGCNPRVFGKDKEVGLCQIKPDGQASRYCTDLDWNNSDAENVRCGARLLQTASKTCRTEDASKYLVLYNAGKAHCGQSKYGKRVLELVTLVHKKKP